MANIQVRRGHGPIVHSNLDAKAMPPLRKAHMEFTPACDDQRVTTRVGARYEAIVWQASADIDNAIRLVRTFHDPQDAILGVARTCQDGQRWAVVDLTLMRVIAKGSSHSGPRPLDSDWPFGADLSVPAGAANRTTRTI
jgi:hypothetical protein